MLKANLPKNIHQGEGASAGASPFSGYRFWSAPEKLGQEFHDLKKALQNGKDGLLMGGSKYQERHLELYKALRSHGIDQVAEVRPIFVVGHPASLLNYYVNYCSEQWLHGKVDEISAIMLAHVCGLPKLIENAQAEWGLENVETCLDVSPLPDKDAALTMADRLYAAWGYGACVQPPALAWHKGFLGSATAIKFFLMPATVQDNEWPPLNKENLMLSLVEFDRQCKADMASTLEFRRKNQEILAETARRLEELAGVGRDTLRAPEWYTEAPCVSGIPLDREQCALFARHLRSDVADCLFQRFSLDEMALDRDQKQLLLALRGSGKFTTIGSCEEQPVLTVLTMTRNHEKYIGECMDSVLAQKTDFPVQHLVLDHYSTDGTPGIIAEYASRYPSIRPVLLKAGTGCYDNVSALLGRCCSEYAALCDGDDFFSDENKLQLQVNFLRRNPQCALVFHPVKVAFEDGRPSLLFPESGVLPGETRKEYCLTDLLKGNIIQTNSVVYRWRFREGLPDWFKPRLCPGDWYWHLLHAETGKIGFIPRVMSVYRRHANALYVNSFRDSRKHRQQFGMKELEAYSEINSHFKGRYFEHMALLAVGVLADLMESSLNGGDSAFFDEAVLKYPEFGLYFLKGIQSARSPQQSAKASDKG